MCAGISSKVCIKIQQYSIDTFCVNGYNSNTTKSRRLLCEITQSMKRHR